MTNTPLIEAKNVSKIYTHKKINFFAVKEISLEIFEGDIIGLVGESGCGKSTIGKLLLNLITPSAGELFYQGESIQQFSREKLTTFRKEAQMVFQDPFSSLDPRMTAGELIEEPMLIHNLAAKSKRKDLIRELVSSVGLSENQLGRFPHEFSGGQRQRIGIARALASNPLFLVCDEPIAALDVSIQAQILNLLKELKNKRSLSYLFISHDLAVVKHLCTKVYVMYLGSIVESATKDQIFSNPKHPYTKALLSSVIDAKDDQSLHTQKITVQGEVPSPLKQIKGCPFHTRCPSVMDVCKEIKPKLKSNSEGHKVACHLYE